MLKGDEAGNVVHTQNDGISETVIFCEIAINKALNVEEKSAAVRRHFADSGRIDYAPADIIITSEHRVFLNLQEERTKAPIWIAAVTLPYLAQAIDQAHRDLSSKMSNGKRQDLIGTEIDQKSVQDLPFWLFNRSVAIKES